MVSGCGFLSRYVVSGTVMPNFIPWLQKNTGLDLSLTAFSQVSVVHVCTYISSKYLIPLIN